MKKASVDLFGGFTLVIFSLMLGLNQVLIKIVNIGIQPVLQAGLRSLIALIPILIFSFFYKRSLSIKDGSLRAGILCGLIFSIEFIFLFKSLELTSVARASILFYSMPVWLCLSSHFLIPGESLSVIKIIGLLFAVLGVGAALFLREIDVSGSFLGDYFALVAGILWCSIVLIVRTTKLKNSSPEMQIVYQLAVSTIVLIPISFLFGDLIRDLSYEIIAILIFQSVIIVAAGFLIWFWILSIYPVSTMASFGFLSPVFGVIFGWLILGEKISMYIVVSLMLVSIGIILINQKKK